MERIKLNKSDKLFIDSIPRTKQSAHYGWIGGGYGAFKNYYVGYKKAFYIIFKEWEKASKKGAIDILDTLVFPYCFVVRHMAETFIKYLYMKYASYALIGEEDKKKFLNHDHNIYEAWKKTRPIIDKVLKDQTSTFDLEIVDSYVKQIYDFDNRSMKMRYPCNKKLEATNTSNEAVNIIHLHKHVESFFNYLEGIDNEITGTLLFFQ